MPRIKPRRSVLGTITSIEKKRFSGPCGRLGRSRHTHTASTRIRVVAGVGGNGGRTKVRIRLAVVLSSRGGDGGNTVVPLVTTILLPTTTTTRRRWWIDGRTEGNHRFIFANTRRVWIRLHFQSVSRSFLSWLLSPLVWFCVLFDRFPSLAYRPFPCDSGAAGSPGPSHRHQQYLPILSCVRNTIILTCYTCGYTDTDNVGKYCWYPYDCIFRTGIGSWMGNMAMIIVVQGVFIHK